MKPALRSVASQPSWIIRSRDIELAVTKLGGHMAPVTFRRRSRRPISPYYVSPWQSEGLKIDEPVLLPLRGDFFCLPFGGGEYRGEKHPAHGETAGRTWRLAGCEQTAGVTTLTLTLRTRARAGKVTKHLRLADGHDAVYVSHTLEGFSGRMPLGHHATLAVPEKPGDMRIAVSPFRFGQTAPGQFGDPAAGEYTSLASGRRFRDLRKVPLIWASPRYGDCSRLPTREGFTDLLAVFARRDVKRAWTTATVVSQRYLWFSLKDPRALPTTAMWISNRGRHGPPWNGRNRCVGLEDVCAYFDRGLAESVRANPLSKSGIPTAVELSPDKPTPVNYIEGAVPVPGGFDRVADVQFADDEVRFIAESGKSATATVKHDFLDTGEV
ncbi:MAG: hypothetical protein ACOC9S_02220 [Planctomycetota bacterium]